MFKISPQTPSGGQEQFDLSGMEQLSEPSAIKPDDHVLGNPEAKNTAIIYEDLQCPACASFEPIAEQIPLQFTDTKLVFRHFPLTNIHKNAAAAAFAAEAAAAQGKFWEFTKLAYGRQGEWQNLSDPFAKFTEIAEAAGVPDMAVFAADYSSKKYKERVQRDLREALSLNVSGTPSLYFNGKPMQLGGIEDLKKQAEALYVK